MKEVQSADGAIRNVIVIGLGSMGKRRIRLLKERKDIKSIFGVDAREDRREAVEKSFGILSYESLDRVLQHETVDCAFVCTSPLSHGGIIRECLENNLHVFTEINLVSDGYEENVELAKAKGRVLFMSSTFLYREEIRFMQKEVKGQVKPVNYVYHVGQYLPDWHPWENYKDFFVGDKRTNGCREIMAIELPWLIETFGAVKRVSVMHDKMSQLNVEYDDNYMIQLVHENGNKGVIVVDIVCPRAVRNLEVYSEDTYMSWNGRPDGLKKYDRKKDDIENIMLYDYVEHKSGYQSTIIENAYADEIEEFLDVIAGKSAQTYGFEKDAKVLEWLDCIEG